MAMVPCPACDGTKHAAVKLMRKLLKKYGSRSLDHRRLAVIWRGCPCFCVGMNVFERVVFAASRRI
jgi:hypothetical protein